MDLERKVSVHTYPFTIEDEQRRPACYSRPYELWSDSTKSFCELVGLIFIQLWKLLAEILKLWQIVVNDVRLVRMVCQIVLVVAFGFMERV